MFEESITVKGEKYILGPYLASGLIGTVFPAWKDGDERKKLVKAVKVRAPNLTDDLKKKFLLEFQTLSNLNKKWEALHPSKPSPFPIMEKVEREDGTDILVMDYIPDEKIVSRVFKDSKTSIELEVRYLEAARQYIQMLRTLHQAGYTCPDRKTPDVRWHEDRLVVLDWNVVKEKENPLPEDIQQDYYLFGSMWHQFLTGRYAAVNLNMLDDEYWGDLSIGTRVLLKSLLQGQYTDDSESKIETYIGKLLDWRGKDASTLAMVARKSWDEIKMLEDVIQSLLKSKQKEDSYINFTDNDLDALIQIDLAWRLGGDVYQEDRGKLIQFIQDRPKRFIYYAQIALLRGNYQSGLDAANRLHNGMRAADAGLRLLLERWRVLLQTAISQPDTFREPAKTYSDWLSNFREPSSDEDALQFWQKQLDNFPKALSLEKSNLEVFLKELELRRAWAEFHKLEISGKYAQAQQVLTNVRELLDEINSLNSEYADVLKQAVLGNLEKYEKDIVGKVTAESEFGILQETAEFATQGLMAYKYLRYRIQDGEWQTKLQSVLNDITNLSSIVPQVKSNNDVTQIIGILCKLLSYEGIFRGLGLESNQVLVWLRELRFPPGLEGVESRLSVANYFSKSIIPSYLYKDVSEIQIAYVHDAFVELAKCQDLTDIEYKEALEFYKSCNFTLRKEG